MKNGFKKILGVVLLLFVFLGTTGVTFYHHVCACKPISAVVVSHSSCCEPVKVTHSCCGPEKAEKPAEPVQGCANHHKGCKEIPVYFTASIIGLPVIKNELLKHDFTPVDFAYAVIPDELVQKPAVTFVFTAEDPPPIGGKQLLFSLHQLKIPFVS